VLHVVLGTCPIPEEWLPLGDGALDRYRLENSCTVNVDQLKRVARGGITEFSVDYTEKTVTRSKSVGSVLSIDNEGHLDQMLYSVACAESGPDTTFMIQVALPTYYGAVLQGVTTLMADGSDVLQKALVAFASKFTQCGLARGCFFHGVLQKYTTMYCLRDDDDDGGHGPMAKSWLRDILFCAQTPDEHRACCSELVIWIQAPAQQVSNPFWSELLLWVEHVLKDERKLGNAFVPGGIVTMYTQSGYNEADNNRFKAAQGRQMATSLEMLGTQMGAMGQAAERKKVRAPRTTVWCLLTIFNMHTGTLLCTSVKCNLTRCHQPRCSLRNCTWAKCTQRQFKLTHSVQPRCSLERCTLPNHMHRQCNLTRCVRPP